jgi:hypothetical protein
VEEIMKDIIQGIVGIIVGLVNLILTLIGMVFAGASILIMLMILSGVLLFFWIILAII